MRGQFEANGTMWFMFGVVFTAFLMVLVPGFFGFRLYTGPQLGENVEINVTNYNLDKVAACTDELDACSTKLEQIKDVKKVVCAAPASEYWQLLLGGLGGIALTVYFGFVVWPGIRRDLEKKASVKARVQLEAEQIAAEKKAAEDAAYLKSHGRAHAAAAAAAEANLSRETTRFSRGMKRHIKTVKKLRKR